MALEILLQPGLPAAPSLLQRSDHRLQQLIHLALVPPELVHGKVSDTTKLETAQENLSSLVSTAGLR